MKVDGFTQTYNGITRRIITDCYVSESIDPDEPSTEIGNKTKYKALWDTGATISMIDQKVAKDLELLPSNMGRIYHANGSDIVPRHKVCLTLPNGVSYPNIDVFEGKLDDCDVLFGMDIISKGDFSITYKDGKTIFSIQMPSTHTIDFVDEIKDAKKYLRIYGLRKKHGNEKCPCGSNKFFKNCHGKYFIE